MGLESRVLISVVIPTFDRIVETIAAIDSVQSRFPDLVEIIVVDDCGGRIFQYPADLNKHLIPVKVVRAINNSGPATARHLGVGLAAGEYIAFLDSDDTYSKDWIDAVLGIITQRSRSKLMLVGSCRDASLVVKITRAIIMRFPAFLRLYVARLFLLFSNIFHTPSVVLSKSACFFEQGARYCEDFYTNARGIYSVDEFFYLDNESFVMARAQGSAGGISSSKFKMLRGENVIRFKLLMAPEIGFWRILLPFGVFYQISRECFLMIIRVIR